MKIEWKIKTSVPIPLKAKNIIPLAFHQIDFDWEITTLQINRLFFSHKNDFSFVWKYRIVRVQHFRGKFHVF